MKNHLILKIFLIVILILLIIFIVHTTRNYIILNKIFTQELEIIDKTNLSFTRKQYNEYEPDKISTFDCYGKDNKLMLVMRRPYETIKNVILWDDNQTSEQIIMLPETLIAYTGSVSNYIKIPTILESSKFNNFGFKLLLAMTSFITNDKVDDQDCYYVRINFFSGVGNRKAWVSKDSGIIIKEIVGFNEVDGKLYNEFSEVTSYSFDGITDEMVTKPNLTGYTIVDLSL